MSFQYMKNSIKNWLIWTIIWLTPLSSSANNEISNSDFLINNTQIELATAIDSDKEFLTQSIDPKIITNAALRYFDEEVKAYKLKKEAKQKIAEVLNSYFSAHSVIRLSNNGKLIFKIDNKKEFSRTTKEIVDILLNNMPFLVRKVWVLLFFGWEWSLHKKLDNLDKTMWDMKSKEYKNIVFDYVWWIFKRVAEDVGWKMTINEYYDSINRQYPNKNSENIIIDLKKSWQWDVDIKYLNYPFKK